MALMRDGMDLGLMLGELREQGRQIMARLGHMDNRMQDGDRLFHHMRNQMHGFTTRLTSLEEQAKAAPPAKPETPGPTPAELLIKEIMRYAALAFALWATGSVENAVKLIGALK